MTQIPSLDLDPFSIEFFENPHPVHEVLREAGPVVRLDKWNVYGVARYAEVHAVLNDPLTFCSSRGVGLSDFAKEKPWRPASLILEADPPAHTRTRAVLNRVLSPTVMKQLRGSFVAAAEAKVDELLAKGSFDAIPDLAEAYPLSVFPDALGLKQEGRENSAALCGPRLQRVRAAEQAAPGCDRALGAAPGLYCRTMPARESCARRFRRLHPRAGRYRRHHARRGAIAGALAAQRRPRYDRQRHRRRGLLPGAVSRSICAAAQRSDAGAQRV